MIRPPTIEPFTPERPGTATFFANIVLPRLAAQLRIVDAVDLTIIEMPEEAF